MAMVINTNIGSENAIRLLDKTSRSQATSMERLTSGQKINHSKDDASGQSVVVNMTSQSRGLTQAVSNANDGMNMIQTADGALGDGVELLQRMREIGIQAMNETYTDPQRADMNEEFQSLNAELTRIGQTTKFNNQQVLSTAKSYQFQIGWENGTANQVHFSTFALASIAGSVTALGVASAAVSTISAKLQSIQTQRAKWGALQNRLENSVSNLNNVNENVKSSRSRLNDTDYAKESANLARTQVLQQAGMSMLSQANQGSQNILSLLR